jgi:hypothetical protein
MGNPSKILRKLEQVIVEEKKGEIEFFCSPSNSDQQFASYMW